MTQKQFKLVTRINNTLLITKDTTQKQSKLVTRINLCHVIGNQQYFINTGH
jgi:hypothetical protein